MQVIEVLHLQPLRMASGELCIEGIYTRFPEASLSHRSLLPQMQVGIFKFHPDIPEVLSAAARAFILSCFEPEPRRRATATDLLKNTFIIQVNKCKKTQTAPKPSGETYLDSWVTHWAPGFCVERATAFQSAK